MQSSSWKEILLGILTIAAGLANAYLWKGVIYGGTFEDMWFYSVPVAVLIAFIVLFSLSSAFIRSRAVRSGSAALALATNYLLVPYSTATLSALALTGLGAWYAAEQMSKENRTANYFSARKTLRAGIPVFLSAFALVLAVFYYSSIAGEGEKHIFLPRAVFDNIMPYLEKPLGGIFPQFKVGASVDDILLSIISRSADITDISAIPQAEREELIRQAREALTKQFGITLTGREMGNELLYEVTNAQIEKFLGPYKKYIPLIAATGFFIAVRTFAIPVYWLVLIIMPIVVKLLVAAGALKKETATIQVEQITL